MRSWKPWFNNKVDRRRQCDRELRAWAKEYNQRMLFEAAREDERIRQRVLWGEACAVVPAKPVQRKWSFLGMIGSYVTGRSAY